MAAKKADDEDGEKYASKKSASPAWGADAKLGDHLWVRSSASGDLCYVGSNGCTARGQKKRRIKCASCKICVHTECLRNLMSTMKVFCRKTFQDAENGTYRENTDVPHHWVAKKSAKGKCRTCNKTCGGKVCNLLNDIGMSCSWCKEVCHNRDTCFDANKFSTESCNLGAHSNLIVPPTWIVKLPEEEAENSKTVFVVKPIPSTKSTPLLVFINPKSGGNQGSRLMRTFQWLLNPRQVFDLTEGGPGLGLELYKRVPNLRILACGGDGTVGWVLSILDKLKLCTAPPVAVLPLGTGNDLARALGWGGGYTDEPIPRILSNIEGGEIVRLDRWILKVSPNQTATDNSSKDARKDLPLTVVNNYFSLGVDAHVALEFHEAREANPQKFNSRIRNKMFYGQMGGKDLIQRKWKDLSNFVTLECDGKDVTQKLKELRVHAILFLNICSYGGGTRPWGGGNQFQAPSTEDGLIEIIGLTTYQLPILQAGGHGSSIAQCRKAKLVTSCTVPVQVDGEPCRLLPSIVEIDLLNTVNMIARAKKHGTAIKKENVEITLPLKLIPLYKYESEHQRKSALTDGAMDFGTLTITYNTELSEVRSKVRKLLEEKTKENGAKKDKNGRRCSKIESWWFLDSCSGGKFYRIDEAQEHLFYVNDICDEVLYVLEQSDSADEITNDYLKAGRECDDVSRVSTSSSGRQSESGEEREAQEGEQEYEEGEYEEGEYEEGEYEEGEYEEGEYEEGEYEEGEYDEGEYDEGEYDEGEEGEGYEERDPEIPTPDYSVDDGHGVVSPTQIIVETASDMGNSEQDIDESEAMENAKDLLAVPEKRSSISSLKIDESEMDIITAAKFGNLNRVAELHNKGVSLAERDHEGRTPLHHAAFIGNLEVVRYLAAYVPIGVLDARDEMMYQTALHRAALRGDRKICSILVSSGAALEIRDKEGRTAQDLAEAIGDKNLAKYLETMAQPVIL